MEKYSRPYMEFGNNPFSDSANIRQEALNEANNDPKLHRNKDFASYFKLYTDAYNCINYAKVAYNAELHARMNEVDPEFVNQQINKIMRLYQEVELINSQPVSDYQQRTASLMRVLQNFISDQQKLLPVFTDELKNIVRPEQAKIH